MVAGASCINSKNAIKSGTEAKRETTTIQIDSFSRQNVCDNLLILMIGFTDTMVQMLPTDAGTYTHSLTIKPVKVPGGNAKLCLHLYTGQSMDSVTAKNSH